jgi:FdhE protein
MPPAAPAPATRASRQAEAARRWARISAAKPDLEPAVSLQRQLLGIVIDLTETMEHGRLPRLSLPPRYLAAKLARGVPALAGEPMPLPIPALTPSLSRLCRELAQGGAGEAADHIRTAIDEGRMEPGSLLTASFKRDQQSIRTGAVHRGLSPDLVWLIAELAVSPFAHVLQRALLAPEREEPALTAALAAWKHGYCPACGSWPALAEIADSHRVLRCSFCAHGWEMTTLGCAYCGEAGEKFVTVAPHDDRADERVEVCGGCGGYLKTVDVAALSPFPLLAIADLETMELDMKAMERGYRRPPLKDFTKRQPQSAP